MKFGLMGVGSGSTVRPDMLTQIAQKGEELGFESAWIPEHLAVPVEMKANYPGSADGKFPGGPGWRYTTRLLRCHLLLPRQRRSSSALAFLSCRCAIP